MSRLQKFLSISFLGFLALAVLAGGIGFALSINPQIQTEIQNVNNNNISYSKTFTADTDANWTLNLTDADTGISICTLDQNNKNSTYEIKNIFIDLEKCQVENGKSYNITLFAVNSSDKDDNTTVTLISIKYLDIKPPVIIWKNYINKTYTRGALSLEADILDDNELNLNSIKLYLNGTEHDIIVRKNEDNKNITVEATLNINQDGLYKLKLVAEDIADDGEGNINESILYFIVDNAPPEIKSIAITPNATDNSIYVPEKVNISVIIEDRIEPKNRGWGYENPKCILYINGLEYDGVDSEQLDENTFKCTFENVDLSGYSNLEKIVFNVTVEDEIGNTNWVSKEVTLDKEFPVIRFEYNVSDFNRWYNKPVNVTVNVTDEESGVKEVYYAIVENSTDCSNIENWNETNDNIFNVIVGDDEGSGLWKVCVKAKDNVGNINIANLSVIKIDKEKPRFEVNPVNRSWDNTTVEINVNATDEYSGIKEFKYNITKGECPIDLSYYNEVPQNGNITIDKEGEWYLCLYAKDNAGNVNITNETTKYGPYQIDFTPPEVNIKEIIENRTWDNKTYIKGTVTVKVEASDNISGIKEVRLYANGSLIGSTSKKSNDYYEFNWNTKEYGDGTYILKAEACDFAGNCKNSTEIQVIVDNTPPRINRIELIGYDEIRIVFDEPIVVENGSIAFENVRVWKDGTIIFENAVVSCENVNKTKEIICNVDKPLTKDSKIYEDGIEGITDLAGNEVDITDVTIENAADILYYLPKNNWTYIAFETEIDEGYNIFNEALEMLNKSFVYKFVGKWENIENFSPLLAYDIYVNLSKDMYLPVKYKELGSTSVQLKQGWNLIAVLDTEEAVNKDVTEFDDDTITETSLESLASYGQRYYKFAWIVDSIEGEIKSGENKESLAGWVRDMRPYWVYLLEDTVYSAPVPPEHPE